MVLMRGFAGLEPIPSMLERYKLKAACSAIYPDYKGISRLVGMDILEHREQLKDQLTLIKEKYNDHDFFFIHVKKTDSSGEDGDFDAKVGWIGDTDKHLSQLLDLEPDVLVITGDHSTPRCWPPTPGTLCRCR